MNVAVFGAHGGLGEAFVRLLQADPAVAHVHALSRREPHGLDPASRFVPVDLTDEESIAASAGAVHRTGPVHLVIVATGLLHGPETTPEKRWRDLEPAQLSELFRINTIGPALVAKHFLPLLDRDRRSAFCALSARVGSIADNKLGGWHGYRASKAALNMMIRTLSVELAHRNPGAFAISLHPGTVDTALSEPFQRSVPDGKLFTPDYAAARLLDVIDRRSPADSGGLFAWDGEAIPY